MKEKGGSQRGSKNMVVQEVSVSVYPDSWSASSQLYALGHVT